MNGIHDVGGNDGFGAVITEPDEPVYHAEWEKATVAMFPAMFAAGMFNIDEFRFSIERMTPVDYLTHPYYAHWMHAFEEYAVRAGVDPAELAKRTEHYLANPDSALPDTTNPDLLSLMETIISGGGSARRPVDDEPKFAVGQRVRIADDVPYGHTRRARYIRGRTGTIELVHGSFIYPDAAASGQGDDPQHVYTVRFAAEDLHGVGIGDPNACVYIDTWEPYLTEETAS